MRGFLLPLVFVAGCSGNAGTDCVGEAPVSMFVPRIGACVAVGSEEACMTCYVGGTNKGCIVGDARELDLAPCFACAAGTTEADCIEHAGCVATYLDGVFDGCRSVAPSGPVPAAACSGLDAHECDRHDNCALRYLRSDTGSRMFERCADEIPASSLAAGDGG